MAGELREIASGGQTGVDRGVPCRGWYPLGRWAEDGPIAARYPLWETPDADRTAGQAESLRQFIGQHGIGVLNVAGPREWGEPGVVEFVAWLLEAALGREGGWQN
jgi:hypothetical protein